jgi:hypothetical protein
MFRKLGFPNKIFCLKGVTMGLLGKRLFDDMAWFHSFYALKADLYLLNTEKKDLDVGSHCQYSMLPNGGSGRYRSQFKRR